MFKELLSVFYKEQRNERREIVKIDASIDFSQGIIFGRIYDISQTGFMMLTDSDCSFLPLNLGVQLMIDEDKFTANITRKGSKLVACKFKKALSEEQIRLLVRKSA